MNRKWTTGIIVIIALSGYFIATSRSHDSALHTEHDRNITKNETRTTYKNEILISKPIDEKNNSPLKDKYNCNDFTWKDYQAEPMTLMDKKIFDRMKNLFRENSDISVETVHLALQAGNNTNIDSNTAKILKEKASVSAFLVKGPKVSKEEQRAKFEQFNKYKTFEQLLAGIKKGEISTDYNQGVGYGEGLLVLAREHLNATNDAQLRALISEGVKPTPFDMLILLRETLKPSKFLNQNIDVEFIKQHFEPAELKSWLEKSTNIGVAVHFITTDKSNTLLDFILDNGAGSVQHISFGTLADELVKHAATEPDQVLIQLNELANRQIYPSQESLNYIHSGDFREAIQRVSDRRNANPDDQSTQYAMENMAASGIYEKIIKFASDQAKPIEFAVSDEQQEKVDNTRDMLENLVNEVDSSVQYLLDNKAYCLAQLASEPVDKSQLTDVELFAWINLLETQGMSSDEIDKTLAEYSKSYVRKKRRRQLYGQSQPHFSRAKHSQKDLETLDKLNQILEHGGAEHIETALSEGTLSLNNLTTDPVTFNVFKKMLQKNRFDVIKLLLSYGSSKEILDRLYLQQARLFNKPSQLASLQALGVDLNQRYDFGGNLFSLSVNRNNFEVAKYLYENGIDIDPDPYNIDSLDIALEKRNHEAIAFLMGVKFPLKTSHKQRLQKLKEEDKHYFKKLLTEFPALR